MKPEDVDLEAILVELGHCGWFQVKTFVLILLGILANAIYNAQYIFMAADVDYRCAVPECEASPPEFDATGWASFAYPKEGGRCHRLLAVEASCTPSAFTNVSEPCNYWIFQNNNTIVAEYGLACQDWKRTMVGTVQSIGVLVGLILTGPASDMYGRRMTFILTSSSRAFTGLARYFAPSYLAYLAFEFLDAMLGCGSYSTGFILALELLTGKVRVYGANCMPIVFAIGQVVLALTAWAVPYWKTLTLVLYLPAILFLLYFFCLEESVRWLISRGKSKAAMGVLNRAAHANKVHLSPHLLRQLEDKTHDIVTEASATSEGKAQGDKRPLCSQVCHSRVLMSRAAICSFWWTSVTLIYYGLSINSVSLAGNIYVNYILTSLVEIPGYLMSMVFLDRFGRKSSIMGAFFFCSISLLALPFIQKSVWHNVLTMCGKLCISMVFSSIYIYTLELFPTAARHSLMGIASTVGRIGSIAAPQTPLLMKIMESLPYLIFGIMAALSGLLMLLTPETLRLRLPDTVAQAENMHVQPRRLHKSQLILDN